MELLGPGGGREVLEGCFIIAHRVRNVTGVLGEPKLDPCFSEAATGARSDDVAAEELEDAARSRDLETSTLSLWRFRHRRRSFFIENKSEGRRTIKLNGASWSGDASLSQAGENVCQSGLCRRAEATKRASSGRLHSRTC